MASTAAIFDKQELRSQQDLLAVGQLLDDALAEFIKGKGEEVDPTTKDKLAKVVDEVAKQTQQFLCFTDDSYSTGLTTPSGTARSPMLPPLSPPPFDAEVAALEAEVVAATKKVAELRVSMQTRIQQQLSEKLASCEPTAEWTPPVYSGCEPSTCDEPSAEELRSKLGSASTKLPGLRAQLEDAYNRMERVLKASEPEVDRPPPNTVERAVLGLEAEEEEEAGLVSTALKRAMQSGRLSMRRGREPSARAEIMESDEDGGGEVEEDVQEEEEGVEVGDRVETL